MRTYRSLGCHDLFSTSTKKIAAQTLVEVCATNLNMFFSGFTLLKPHLRATRINTC